MGGRRYTGQRGGTARRTGGSENCLRGKDSVAKGISQRLPLIGEEVRQHYETIGVVEKENSINPSWGREDGGG